MGYWLLLFISLFFGIIIIDNAFDNQRKKIPYYGLLVILFLAGIAWGYYDWRQHTLDSYEVTPSYLILNYLSGETEHIAYTDIENIKFYVMGKTSSHCGLSFYIKGKDNLRTLADFQCTDIRALQGEINQKIITTNE